MPSDSTGVEQTVSRVLRDNLERLQRSAIELDQAVSDLVAACASSRPANALSPMIRAQTAAGSLVATMEILSRFVTSSLQSGQRVAEQEIPAPALVPSPEPVPAEAFSIPLEPPKPVVKLDASRPLEPMQVEAPAAVVPNHAGTSETLPPMQAEPAPIETMAAAVQEDAWEKPPDAEVESFELLDEPLPPPAMDADLGVDSEALPPEAASFDLSLLPLSEQEMHRRANRVAKVSMQDIKMLRPEDVALGRTHHDLCLRLRDDIEKAYKEYDRRFQAILGHPVDYFYDWMVEILGGGDPTALGEYPFPTAAVRH